MKDIVLTFNETLQIKQALWRLADRVPQRRLYALLDGARSRRVEDLVVNSRLPWRCLYDGLLSPTISRVAPYLVALDPGSIFDMDIIAHGFGESWGLFIESPVEIDDLRRHLRRFLKVETEDARRLLFRFYDPRVLRVYLPTCRADELATFFGPIRTLYVEPQPPTRIDAFTVEAGKLVTRSTPLGVATLDRLAESAP